MLHRPILQLEGGEADALHDLARELARQYSSSDDPQLVFDLPVLSHGLAPRLKREVHRFRLEDRDAYLHLRGHRMDHARIGPTPADWRDKTSPDRSLREEIVLLLYAGLLGDPFGWRTQQDGHLVHEVFPIARDQDAQISTGSRELLTWHTEDAFHPCRADYLLLLAIRNPGRVPTTVGHLDLEQIEPGLRAVLFEERFYIRPDESHLPRNNTTGADPAFAEILRMRSQPRSVPILSGDRTAPYTSLDPYFMHTDPGDVLAGRALAAVIAAIEASLHDVVLEAGDVLILDNRRAVHGRRPFVAKYDGQDRWLKRVNVTRDLRRSRPFRSSPTSRLIG